MGDAYVRFILFVLLLVGILEAKRGAGPYLGGGYGISSMKDKGYFDLEDDRSKGYMIYGGAYINDYLSVELEYIGGLAYKQKEAKSIDPNLIAVNAQAHYPFYNGMFDIFAKFGAGEIKLLDNGFTMLYGAGFSYRIDERYAMRVGYDYFDIGVDESGNNSADGHVKIDYSYFSFEVQF